MKLKPEFFFEAGIPRSHEALAAAQKAAGIALSRGARKESLRACLLAMARGEPPEGEAAALHAAMREVFAPLGELLEQSRRGRIRFEERASPAPWRSWADRSLIEAGALEQMESACRLPVAAGGALMPDAHTGYGLPIGGVLAVRHAVIPYAVGVDIACRMRLTVFREPASLIERDGERLAAALESETRFGVGAAFGAGERRSHPVMQEDWGFTPPTRTAAAKAAAQLGTSGSGNHFVEFGTLSIPQPVSEPGLSLPAGTYLALLSHSGSRGAGEAVAEFYSQLAQSLHPELPEELKRLAWLELGTPEGEAYWQAMELMGRYASANHALIHESITRRLGLEPVASVENHHNFAWKERFGGEELIVHRKGATPAGEGVLGIVPGSMGAPGFVVRGKGNPASFASCSHGAGRLMSRKAAFRTLSRETMEAILKERGVRLLSGPLDESPEVYKDIRDVISRQADLVDVLAEFSPRIVKMAPAEGFRPAWGKKR